jgi:hypothetical protein
VANHRLVDRVPGGGGAALAADVGVDIRFQGSNVLGTHAGLSGLLVQASNGYPGNIIEFIFNFNYLLPQSGLSPQSR